MSETNIRFHSAIELAQMTEVYLLSKPKKPELGINSMPNLNQMIWGLGRGRAIIVAGRTSMGKSAFMTQMAWDFAMANYKTMYLSIEMPQEELYSRCFSRNYKINNRELEHGEFVNHLERYKEFKSKQNTLPLFYSDGIGFTWKEVDAMITSMPHKKPDCIFIDHINHIKTSGINDKAVIDDYLTNILAMARKTNITFVIGAQINRFANKDNKNRPELHYLKGTGRLEEIADLAFLLHWPYFYDDNKPKNAYEIIVAKNRYGATGVHDCHFYPQYSLFTEKNNVQKVNKEKDLTKSKIKEEDIEWKE